MSIVDVAFRVGGQRILAAAGDESGAGTELLREAIAAHAADGNAAIVNATIESLFPNDDSLTSEQLGQLGTALVENYQP
jgi:hypothetical protein